MLNPKLWPQILTTIVSPFRQRLKFCLEFSGLCGWSPVKYFQSPETKPQESYASKTYPKHPTAGLKLSPNAVMTTYKYKYPLEELSTLS